MGKQRWTKAAHAAARNRAKMRFYMLASGVLPTPGTMEHWEGRITSDYEGSRDGSYALYFPATEQLEFRHRY